MLKDNSENNWLLEKAISRPLTRAIISRQSTLSFHDLFKRSLDTAGYLKSKGVAAGDHVGIIFSHNYEFFIIVNALWFLGAVPVPLNTRNSPGEMSDQIERAKIKHLVIDEFYNESFNSISFPDVFYYSRPIVESFSITEDVPVEISKFDIDSNALVMFTSGSSGKSKAVVHTFGSLRASAMLTDSVTHFSNDDILLASLPFYHIGGFMVLIRGLLTTVSVALPESLKYEDICASLTAYNPTVISIVPTTLLRFNQNGVRPGSSLRMVFLGGGPASDDIIKEAAENKWPVVKVYGSTETCSMVTLLKTDEISAKPNCAGNPINGVELRIKNEELTVKTPSLFKEYYGDESETKNKIIEGYYYTGDFGRLDDDGYLYIESRREDLVISGGENISIKEIENAILLYNSVEDTAVMPLEDKQWGQIACAVIQLKKECSAGEDELKDFLSEKISSYKIPKKFVFVDVIPRNEMGKINRKKLLKLIMGK